jgi:enediyne polyketide synthase
MRSIAIVGMACRYPDAPTPQRLWENVLTERAAFRRIPPVRLRSQDFQGPDDSICCDTAAVIENFEFDRARYRVSASAYRNIDISHWVALTVAGEVLEHLRYESHAQNTGVFVGNTLTSEFARANLMRLRWPYVERVLRTALQQDGRYGSMEALLPAVESLYKSPFPATSEESLAGGLSNTIAGRICNSFNLQGGGFTIDGACASSLLAVTNACSLLENGSLDLALAGGVDLSLDPFELAGFSALGALAQHAMRVYDRRPTGFWPGEGCGFIALMREEDALARAIPILARIRGWGVSSDGHGSITRPEVAGQLLALQRAYQSAGYGIETVSYFEGHGTGTAVGDATELATLKEARRNGGAQIPAAIGSIKTLIGHTKAAAGVAGLIKAVYAVSSQIIPATAGCEDPHPAVAEAGLRCPTHTEFWPSDVPVRAGVSAMGFGGINTHVAIEGITTMRRTADRRSEQALFRTHQDCEVFPLSAPSGEELRAAIGRLLKHADGLSFGELGDCSASLAAKLDAEHRWRAAVVATSPRELALRLDRLSSLLDGESQDSPERVLPFEGLYYSNRSGPARFGLLFPGQSSPVYRDGGLWSRRFHEVDQIFGRLRIAAGLDSETQVAQPVIAAASLAALTVLGGLRIEAELGLGHSLGELLALCWADGITPETAMELASERGRAMSEAARKNPGAMLSVAASRQEAQSLARGLSLVVACQNAQNQTVLSGPPAAIQRLEGTCSRLGIESKRLPVTCAFHSPLMQSAAEQLGRMLSCRQVRPPARRLISSVTGLPVAADVCVRSWLSGQITAPVEFDAAIRNAIPEVDLWLEAGPGRVLTGLVEPLGVRAIALDAGGPSVNGLCHAIAAAFVLKKNPCFEFWFRDRVLQRFEFKSERKYLANPCESIAFVRGLNLCTPTPPPNPAPVREAPLDAGQPLDCLLRLRHLVARHTELPVDDIRGEDRFLTDLHLNSITVTQLVAQAARELELPTPVLPVNYSTVTLADAAAALEELRRHSKESRPDSAAKAQVAGVDTWVRPFAVDWVIKTAPKRNWNPSPGKWQVLSDSEVAVPLVATLKQSLEAESSGLLVYLANPVSASALPVLLHVAQELEGGTVERVVLLQEQSGTEPFFRSLFLEHAKISVTVITGTVGSIAVDRLVAEVLTTAGFREVTFDRNGVRRERRIRALPFPEDQTFPLLKGSRLLVTGGSRGIGLESALALARRHGLKLAILGRSSIDSDAEVQASLHRIRSAGVDCSYHRADVVIASSIREALSGLHIDGIIHAAGINIPERASRLTTDTIQATLAPKSEGLRNVLQSLEDGPPALVVTFGSVIAQTGLDGEAHYALANDWMRRELEAWSSRNPQCRALHLDWSVWAGAGMGDRLGSLDILVRRGISPISIASGVDALDRMICGSKPGFERAILSGRFGTSPTLEPEESDLPLLRFLESQIVRVPGVELVCEAVLSDGADPYFADHEIDGQRLFPAVMGLEAMAQAACAVQENMRLAAIEEIEFARPVVLSQGDSRRIRVAALVKEPGRVEAVLRSEQTEFQSDHFKATFIFSSAPPDILFDDAAAIGEPIPLNPERDLYGAVLFHRGRFRRIERYLELGARQCRTIIRTDSAEWFGAGMPETLLLGDPAARDAAIHSIQACIPQTTLLPVKIRRIANFDTGAPPTEKRVVAAKERSHQGDEYVYDLQIKNPDGRVVEQWEGLTLRKLVNARDSSQWAPALLIPYLEWAAAEFSVPVSVAVRASAGESRAERRRIVAERLIVSDAPLCSRPDGKPETSDGTISFSHMDPLTLGVHGRGCVSCDLVEVQAVDPAGWRDLLGEDLYSLAGVVSATAREPATHAAARVWAAFECLQKTGSDPARRLTFLPERSNGWMCFCAGTKRVVVGMRRLSGIPGPVAVGILVDQQELEASSLS